MKLGRKFFLGLLMILSISWVGPIWASSIIISGFSGVQDGAGYLWPQGTGLVGGGAIQAINFSGTPNGPGVFTQQTTLSGSIHWYSRWGVYGYNGQALYFSEPPPITSMTAPGFPYHILALNIQLTQEGPWQFTDFSITLTGNSGNNQTNIFHMSMTAEEFFRNNISGNYNINGYSIPDLPIGSCELPVHWVQTPQLDWYGVIGTGDVPFSFTYSVTANVAEVPLPPTVWLFGSGLLGLVGWRRLKRG